MYIHKYFIGKIAETIILIIAYTLLRWTFPVTWHSNRTSKCALYTIVIFCSCSVLSFPIGISLLSSVIVSLILSYYLFKAQYVLDNSSLPIAKFDVENYEEKQLIKRCKELNFSEDNINLAIDFFIKRKKHTQIAHELCIETKSVTMRKLRMKQKLNTGK